MQNYKDLELVFSRINDLKNTLELISWDGEVTRNSVKDHINKIITIKSIIYEIATSQEVESMMQNTDIKELKDDWQKTNFSLMKSFFKKIKSIPFEISTELVKKTAICKYDFASAKKEERFEIVYPAFAEMLSIVKKIASTTEQDPSGTKYDALLKSNQIDPSEIEGICISVAPFLKSKLKEASCKTKAEQHTQKINPRKIVEKFLHKDLFNISISTENHFFGGSTPLRIIAKDKGYDALPSLMHSVGKSVYMANLPYSAYKNQPICSPTSLAIYSAQGFLFSHFFLEEKEVAKTFNHIKDSSFNSSVMGSNKFVALTHLMIQFSLEKSLINEEIDPKNLEESFREDMVYYFGQESSRTSVLQNKSWFLGKFCKYPSYLKGMVSAAQIFHIIKSDTKLWNPSKPKLSKVVNWLTENIYSLGALYNTSYLIEKVTGEKLDCRFFKKFV